MIKTVKRERRNILSTLFLIIAGISLFFIGFIIFIFSLPWVLIIIGIFPAIGGLFFMVCGIALIAISPYKPIECVCGKKLNPIGTIKCRTCGQIYKTKDGKKS